MKGISFIESLFYEVVSGRKTQTRRIMNPPPNSSNLKNAKSLYRNGEVLYLKEPYCQDCDYVENVNSKGWDANGRILYRYSGDEISEHAKDSDLFGHWEDERFMPARYARYFIEITYVRAERLQDISDEDCIKEGIAEQRWNGLHPKVFYVIPKMTCELYVFPCSAYADLIDKIYGKGTWESNLFVWVYDFKLAVDV
jgi:hypothetical protein